MRKCGYMEADREDLNGYECETGIGYGLLFTGRHFLN